VGTFGEACRDPANPTAYCLRVRPASRAERGQGDRPAGPHRNDALSSKRGRPAMLPESLLDQDQQRIGIIGLADKILAAGGP